MSRWPDRIHAKYLEIRRDPRAFDPKRWQYRYPSKAEARELARKFCADTPLMAETK